MKQIVIIGLIIFLVGCQVESPQENIEQESLAAEPVNCGESELQLSGLVDSTQRDEMTQLLNNDEALFCLGQKSRGCEEAFGYVQSVLGKKKIEIIETENGCTIKSTIESLGPDADQIEQGEQLLNTYTQCSFDPNIEGFDYLAESNAFGEITFYLVTLVDGDSFWKPDEECFGTTKDFMLQKN